MLLGSAFTFILAHHSLKTCCPHAPLHPCPCPITASRAGNLQAALAARLEVQGCKFNMRTVRVVIFLSRHIWLCMCQLSAGRALEITSPGVCQA